MSRECSLVKMCDLVLGTPELSALVFVQIHIQDINNYAPVFSTTQSYSKAVSEREETGEKRSPRLGLYVRPV